MKGLSKKRRPQPDSDAGNGCRGIVNGIVYSIPFWLLIILAIVLVARAGNAADAPDRKRVNVSHQPAGACEPIRDALGVAGTYGWQGYGRGYDCMAHTVAMLAWGPQPGRFATEAEIIDNDFSPVLVFNECERPEPEGCNTPADEAAGFYLDYLLPLVQQHRPEQKHIVGGALMTPAGQQWMRDFLRHVRTGYGGEYPPQVAGIHVHIYHQGSYTWEQQVLAARGLMAELGRPDWELWVTESGWNGAYDYDEQESAALLTAMLGYWDSPAGRQFDKVYYYTALEQSGRRSLFHCYDGTLFGCPAGIAPYELTHLGQIYAAWEPEPAGEREVPRSWLPIVAYHAAAQQAEQVAPYPAPAGPEGYP